MKLELFPVTAQMLPLETTMILFRFHEAGTGIFGDFSR
jgi:hypothetical protein